MLQTGDVLGNRYRLEDQLASGGMGAVWRATDMVLNRPVAVKVLHSRLFADPGFGARFRAEARMMASLRHPGIVDVYDFGQDGGPGGEVAYLVMSLVDGEPLSARLNGGRRLAVGETLAVVAQAADALHAAHAAGIVHRDVKPGNLLVRPNGGVTLVDFGVARSSTSDALTRTNEIVGTALYMAPEQVTKAELTPATDLYALGAVAYHCLSGHPPYRGDNALEVALRHLDDEPAPLPRDIPEPVRVLVSQALEKDPRQRPSSAAAFAATARAAAAGLATGAPARRGAGRTDDGRENGSGGRGAAGRALNGRAAAVVPPAGADPATRDTSDGTGTPEAGPPVGTAPPDARPLGLRRSDAYGEDDTIVTEYDRRRRRRALMIGLGIAAAVLAIVGIVLIATSLGNGDPTDAPPTTGAETSAPAVAPPGGVAPLTTAAADPAAPRSAGGSRRPTPGASSPPRAVPPAPTVAPSSPPGPPPTTEPPTPDPEPTTPLPTDPPSGPPLVQ